MRPHLLCINLTASAFLLLSAIRPTSSQIVGCDGPNMNCPSDDTATEDEICGIKADGIGVVSFDSNVTSEGPLTWTMRTFDAPGNDAHPSSTGRAFYLGTPPSLDLRDVTNFGACAATLWNLTSDLQLPSGFNDMDNFGCGSVMKPACAQDIVRQVRGVLGQLFDDSSYDASRGSPCLMVAKSLAETGPPESCLPLIHADRYGFGEPLCTLQSK